MDSSKKSVEDTRAESPPPVPIQKVSMGKRIIYFLWDADQHLKSPEERALVRKLDCGILLCATIGSWIKSIDQGNLTNAYVSGMKEDLNIQGNEYTYMLMCYTIAFAIMQIPSNMLALKFSPRILLIICELGWTAFTFAQAATQSTTQMYVFRFMVGWFESGFAPIIIFLMGSWYTPSELAKRVAIWHLTFFFGQATSGILQAAIYASLNGRLGLAGWRWLYIICGCMSLPVALSVWFLLPDYPHNTKAWYLTEADKKLALQRSIRHKKSEITGTLDMKLAKRIFGNWRWWVLCLMYIVYGNSCQANNYFAIYLREAGYSVTQRNLIPACGNIVTMFTDFVWALGSDLTQNRFWWIVAPLMCTTVIGSSILTAWPDADAPKVMSFFFTAAGYVTSVVWTWANEINNGDAEERAITISSMNGLFYATNSFLPILIFPQTMAPKFERGYPTILAFTLATIVLVCITQYFHQRQLLQAMQMQPDLPASEVSDMKVTDSEKKPGEESDTAIEPVRTHSL